ncbi:MAG: chitinase, partial [Lachnospiraceae bacterium]|nr:chitinase [Lachnospiraceae bacterium]
DIEMRRFGGNRSKILNTAKKGDNVTVVENYGSWSQILTEDAILGCIPNGYLKDKETVTNKVGVAQESVSHNLMKEKIRMGWHQIFTSVANSELNSVLTTANGMNVICPTWFQVKDSKGSITNFASADYVNTCHNKGIKVWALVNNLEKDVDESSLLGVASNRENLVNNLVSATVAAGADGINVDIESVGDSNVEGYVEFIKQLALKCHDNNLMLSVDNYNINSADYDVEVQARFADYIVLFGYDETWTGSEKAGSNNSINYVKSGVEDMLEIGVNKNQLILAIPFYTRLWKQTGNTLTSEVVLLKDTPTLLSSNNATATWLKDNKENYAEWVSGDTKNMIWIVDNKSLKERVEYAASKDLAGVSAWKLGSETADTWTMISETMK